MIFQISEKTYEKSADRQTEGHVWPISVMSREHFGATCRHVGSVKITSVDRVFLAVFVIANVEYSRNRLSTHAILVSFHSWTSSMFSVLSECRDNY